MSTVQERKKRARSKALLFGIASVCLYAGMFSFEDVLMPFFAKGGAYCLLPVVTVLLFTYVHANFAGNVWTALGIEASSKIGRTETAVTSQKRAGNRPSTRLRA